MHQVPVVTGEIGENDCSANYVDQYTQWADQNNISYLAWSWQLATDPALGCGASNLDLLSNMDGSPSTISPVGAAFDAHLALLASSG